jgi:hypothetical protein
MVLKIPLQKLIFRNIQWHLTYTPCEVPGIVFSTPLLRVLPLPTLGHCYHSCQVFTALEPCFPPIVWRIPHLSPPTHTILYATDSR